LKLELKMPKSGIYINDPKKFQEKTSLPYPNYNPRTLQKNLDDVPTNEQYRVFIRDQKIYALPERLMLKETSKFAEKKGKLGHHI
jgi:hypothetical protein